MAFLAGINKIFHSLMFLIIIIFCYFAIINGRVFERNLQFLGKKF